MISIGVPCILKAALNKDESEEIKKEVEMALLSLCNIELSFVAKELYLNEIKEIILYHQEHRNLTRLAYQSAWEFLKNRLLDEKSLEEVIMNELHFAKEAAMELEELTECIDWKRKKEGRRRKEAKEVLVLKRWFYVIENDLSLRKLWNKEFVGLVGSLAGLFRAARGNCKEISYQCSNSIREAAEKKEMEVEDLQKGGAIDLCSEEMKQSTLLDEVLWDCLYFFLDISERLKEKTDNEAGEAGEAKRKAAKRKMFDQMEEEGYEDIVASFHGVIPFFNKRYNELTKDLADYFVNV
ncbi:uncharacterized protein MONOS_1372 [Monocercomonoides exilis]|uniref:uncharacterized protein n=1 Tax=Monocercomonoides exilis TaxID=2049356 RepID=UPI00355A19BE|nr:hypothetical protein MONOS_1372 [Monocercomonoides exilis]|eukprot:MONOS_1372.1-p1 / transcript=MONOS_1372.1 / gene=MONOS_1372 / organism=Monocercomonoides_exilis_PA203 / gene_product=unspecified product / transcript_product=unspecified product / location=Mono_scaffold00023:213315-214276(-) / protein_length=296 / sequence_SO=supercontig / SO=protein_coding / is_pseudo=false